MPTPTKGPRLGGGPAHERLMLNNMATSLFKHKRIVTTETKAKRLRPVAERLVTFAKRGDLHARRRVLAILRNKDATHELFAEIAPLVAGRDGGYTRIIKMGTRPGDRAPMVILELVDRPETPKAKDKKDTKTEKSKREGGATADRTRGRRAAAAARPGSGRDRRRLALCRGGQARQVRQVRCGDCARRRHPRLHPALRLRGR